MTTRSPVSWRIRGGWPAEAVVEAVEANRARMARGRARVALLELVVEDLEARNRLLEEIVEARAREADAAGRRPNRGPVRF